MNPVTMPRVLFLAAATAIATPARAQTQPALAQPTVELPAPLDRVLRDYEAAWAARDGDRLAALFHDDGFVLSSGAPPVRGRAAIAERYRNAGGTLRLRAIAFAEEPTVAWIVGMFSGTSGVEAGKFVLALRRDRITAPWLIAADMDNTNSRQEQP